MNDNSKFKLGLFIVFATVVFFVGLLILGSLDRFKEKAYITTLVSESVQGLSVGSSVKYQGVPVGSVRDITLYTSENLIRIDMEINTSKVMRVPGQTSTRISVEEFSAHIEEAVRNGLRCRLELEGITGGKYVEFQYDRNSPPSAISAEQFALDCPYVPSLPSLISDLRGSVTSILAKLESIDYKGISERANTTLDSLNERLQSPKLDETLDNVNAMVASARTSIGNLEKITESVQNEILPDVRVHIDTLTENANTAVKAVDSLAKTVEGEVKAIDFVQINENIRSFLAATGRTIKTFDETLFNVNNAVDALIELIQYIDSDPSALIQGKKKPRTDEPEPDRENR